MVDKHARIAIPGGAKSGVAVVCFNAGAFESYGWSRNANAPVCRSCADAYTTALTRLFSKRYPDPRQPNSKLGQRAVFLSNDTTAIYWTDKGSEKLDLITALFEAPDDEILKHLTSLEKGQERGERIVTLYCVVLSAVQSRAVLRNWHQGILQEIELNLASYFRQVLSFAEHPVPFSRLLSSLALLGKAANIPGNVAGEFFVGVLFGRPFPKTLLLLVLQQCRSQQKVTSMHATVIGLYMVRNLLKQGIGMGLNRNLADRSYRLGRLLAVLERLRS